jgi:DNA-binding response OmpR family regulator
MRILLVEDDAGIRVPLAASLVRSGFEVTAVDSGAAALEAVEGVDLVLLDLGLPDIDGSEVCRRIRRDGAVPVIVISARGDEIDRVTMLDSGADDYVVKPFGTREIVARIRAVARRSVPSDDGSEIVEIGALRLDNRSHVVTLSGQPVELTPKEFGVLAFLAADPGRVRTREEILSEVWDEHWWGPTKTLDVHVASLRRKLGAPGWIITVRGVGFRLDDVGDGP